MALLLDEMTWPELERKLPGLKLAIIPTGRASSTDRTEPLPWTPAAPVRRSGCWPRSWATRFLSVLSCPTGSRPHHMKFPGSITLRLGTYLDLLTDIAVSLKEHGIGQVLLLNEHGGDRYALAALTSPLYHEHGIQAATAGTSLDVAADLIASRVTSKIRGHSCEAEISQCLHLCPETVREDALTPGALTGETRYGRKPWAQYFWSFERITSNGAFGDATKADRELGREITELAVDRLVGFIREHFLDEPAGGAVAEGGPSGCQATKEDQPEGSERA